MKIILLILYLSVSSIRVFGEDGIVIEIEHGRFSAVESNYYTEHNLKSQNTNK